MRQAARATTINVGDDRAIELDHVVGRDRSLTAWTCRLGRHGHAQAGHAGTASSSLMIHHATGTAWEPTPWRAAGEAPANSLLLLESPPAKTRSLSSYWGLRPEPRSSSAVSSLSCSLISRDA